MRFIMNILIYEFNFFKKEVEGHYTLYLADIAEANVKKCKAVWTD